MLEGLRRAAARALGEQSGRAVLEAGAALGSALAFTAWGGGPGGVQGASMLPTFRACCSVVWFSRLFRRERLRAGDVVSATVPGQDEGEVGVVKRVRAVAGDVVLDELAGRALVVPPGHVWLLGDNAADSRGEPQRACAAFGDSDAGAGAACF